MTDRCAQHYIVLGESESSCNIFFLDFVVLSALLIMSAATSMYSLCHCKADLTLNDQLCHCSSINMAAPIFVCNKQDQLVVIQFLWAESVYQGQKSIEDQTLRTTVEWRCITMPICTLPPTLLKPSANWTLKYGAFTIQSWPGPFGLPLVWSTERHFKRLPLCQWPRSERSAACVACHSTKHIFLWGHTKACELLDQVHSNGGRLHVKIMLL
jgi:hypothetical protein